MGPVSRLPRHDRRVLAAIFAGGAAGTLLRAGLVEAWPPEAGHWPWVTFGVNIAGAFLLGWFMTLYGEREPAPLYRLPLLGTGFCGALTTFSSLQLELFRMLDMGHIGLACLYLASSLAVGFAALHLATAAARRRSAAA